ncbi:MAG: hypothetical protein AB8H80_04660 [Planctomycetota bacterium]
MDEDSDTIQAMLLGEDELHLTLNPIERQAVELVSDLDTKGQRTSACPWSKLPQHLTALRSAADQQR